jgi:AAA ATPase domain
LLLRLAENMKSKLIENPYRPGAGHAPPFLAGRLAEQHHFKRLLHNSMITENILITGLRGYGKTVLLDHMCQLAESSNWLWVGNDLSESSSLSEERLALRILADLAQALARKLGTHMDTATAQHARFDPKLERLYLKDRDASTFEALKSLYEQTPGLPSDKLRAVLTRVTDVAHRMRLSGIILAYDEAQCLSDRAEQDEFPMSMLVETISSLQKRTGLTPCLLILSGLPQVFDALTATRTYTERMFHVMTLERLSREDTFAAIMQPISSLIPPLYASPALIEKVVGLTGGYPYLIQFFGREVVDQMLENGGTLSPDKFPSSESFERLDAGLFSARWNRTTDKQRELLRLIARRPPGQGADFSARELEQLRQPHDDQPGMINQMLVALCERGMIYRTRHGRYAFTVPMSEAMITRRSTKDSEIAASWEAELTHSKTPPPLPTSVMLKEMQKQSEQPRKRGWFR